MRRAAAALGLADLVHASAGSGAFATELGILAALMVPLMAASAGGSVRRTGVAWVATGASVNEPGTGSYLGGLRLEGRR